MGSEAVGIFLPAPVLIWAWCIWRLRAPATRTKFAVLLGLGVCFMGYFIVSGVLDGHLWQGLLVGSFFYFFFHVFAWGLITIGINLFRADPE
jgi:hypothetical protein